MCDIVGEIVEIKCMNKTFVVENMQDIEVTREILIDGEYVDIESEKARAFLAPIREAIAYSEAANDGKAEKLSKDLSDFLSVSCRYKPVIPAITE